MTMKEDPLRIKTLISDGISVVQNEAWESIYDVHDFV